MYRGKSKKKNGRWTGHDLLFEDGLRLFFWFRDRNVVSFYHFTCAVEVQCLKSKVSFFAPAGCKDLKNGALSHFFVCYSLYKHIFKSWGKHAHTGGTCLKIRTLNF